LADGFRLSAGILTQFALSDNENDRRRFAPGFSVLAAYSIELYVKCLLAIECGQFPRNHDIEELFKKLKPETREELRKKHDAHPNRPGNLDELLEKGGDSFNKVRYIFARL
jgi:HEPN domain-containing protein